MSLRAAGRRSTRPIGIILQRIVWITIIANIITETRGFSTLEFKPLQQPSKLLSTLQNYEVISIDSPALHTQHPQSIAIGGQKMKQPDAPRTFSSRVSLSFRTASSHHGRLHTDSLNGGGVVDDEIESNHTSSTSHKPVEYHLTKSDLFGPSYSETRQIWRDGIRRKDLEPKVVPLSEIEHCYYRSAAKHVDIDNYIALHTCNGGFSGMIKQDGVTWLFEPAHLHLDEETFQTHLQSFQRRHEQLQQQQRGQHQRQQQKRGGFHTDSFDTNPHATNDDELPLESPHLSTLHILFRPEDVVEQVEAICTVGMSEAQRHEYVKKHPLGHDHADHDHSHDGHSHSHTMSHGAHADDDTPSAYSTWLASFDDKFTRPVAESILSHDLKGDVTYESPILRQRSSASSSPSSSSSSPFHTEAVSTTMRYVELLVTNDFARYTSVGANTEKQSAAIVNQVQQRYTAETSFKPSITVVLIGQITWQESDPYTVQRGVCSACKTNNGVSVDQLLKLWNTWRSNVVNVAPYTHDNAHLFSGFPFEVPTLGYAGVGSMCSNAASGGVETITTTATDLYNGVIVAHEMGHNFGMNHDSTDNTCPQSGYIMNAVLTSTTPTSFSTCSVTYLINWFATNYPTCMNDIPTRAYGDAVCGNGFVEGSESCDCGNKVSCAGTRDPCCNATTCQFLPGASCSGTSTCCENCQVVSADKQKVCRSAINSCDLPEICPGPSDEDDGSSCPTDIGYAAGTECNAGAYGPGLCYLNQCFSYLQQCRTAGANFPGAPFDKCVQQAELNSGNYCGTLWCSSTPGQCTFFRQSGNIIAISDGVPCPDEDSNLKWQCQNSKCVNPNELNVNYQWNVTDYEYCEICTAQQLRNVTCVEKATDKVVANGLCSSASKPVGTRLCVNEEKGCYGDRGRDSDIIDLFGYIELSRKTLIFSTLGFGSAFLIVIGCCYQALTFVGEHEDLPGPSSEMEKKPAPMPDHGTKTLEDGVAGGGGAGLTSSKKARASGKSSKKKKKSQVKPLEFE